MQANDYIFLQESKELEAKDQTWEGLEATTQDPRSLSLISSQALAKIWVSLGNPKNTR